MLYYIIIILIIISIKEDIYRNKRYNFYFLVYNFKKHKRQRKL